MTTFSDSLRLELIVTGEEAGNWGDITNNNLGSLLEQAVAGVASIAHDDTNTFTLTASDGVVDQSRNMVLAITGTLTADRPVIIPDATKVYLVSNETSGGFALTIRTSGGTGAVIPSGKTRWVYCDGTNTSYGGYDANPAGIATLNGGPFSGFRNQIINGDFEFAQYGTSQTSRGFGSVDMWDTQVDSASTYSFTAQQNTFALGLAVDGKELKNYYRCDIATAGSAADDYCFVAQQIESVRTFSGETVTLTFLFKQETGLPIAIEVNQYFGSGGSPSSTVRSYPDNVKITPAAADTWEKVSVTIDIPSISGKTLGSNDNDFLQVLFWFGAGSDYNSRTDNLGHQSGNFDIAHVSLVKGDATEEDDAYPPVFIGDEYRRCARYYQRIEGRSFQGICTGTGACRVNTQLPVVMRADPTATLLTTTLSFYETAFRTSSGSTLTSVGVTAKGSFTGILDGFSGLTLGNPIVGTGAGGIISFSAELGA